MNGVAIIGTGSYVPDQIITNDDLSKIVDTSDEWISSRTGILERRISKDENTSVLGAKAAEKAIEDAQIHPEEIDLIITATGTSDQIMPSTACLIQNRIGATNAACFDLAAACTGFVYALTVAAQFIQTGMYKTILILGAEVLSKITNWEDRGTCVLFGDGAGAAVLQRSNYNKFISSYLSADGGRAEILGMQGIPLGHYENFHPTVFMEGREVFKFAVKIVMQSIDKVLENTKYTVDDIDQFIFHQANAKIIDSVVRKHHLDKEKCFVNIDKYGNTSSASIPIALDETAKKNRLQSGDKIVMVGFGAGMTWGAVLIEW